ncbi:MarR family winged helix-turn-helix transcriptional regulator [Leuconostoc suionicum]|uniref:MarR family winged helix-turn-helix transcriptional regulator n=1 Tax=Leuconostoc suionicum TaxID=1511761 RepID=UPI003748FB8C
MKPISLIFSELYDKVLLQYQQKSDSSEYFPNMSANDEYYIDLLYTLENPTVTSFAEKAKISKPAATRIVHRFVAEKYLVKRPSKVDKRTSYLELSQEIKENCEKNHQLFDQVFLDSISVLSPEEQKVLHKIMFKINEKI